MGCRSRGRGGVCGWSASMGQRCAEAPSTTTSGSVGKLDCELGSSRRTPLKLFPRHIARRFASPGRRARSVASACQRLSLCHRSEHPAWQAKSLGRRVRAGPQLASPPGGRRREVEGFRLTTWRGMRVSQGFGMRSSLFIRCLEPLRPIALFVSALVAAVCVVGRSRGLRAG